MLGKRESQTSLFTADTQYLDKVGRDTFYGFLASHSHEIFRDDDFSDLYCGDNGRDSVPPSVLAIALLLQTYERISDAEVVNRATFDTRWCVALGTELCEKPFAKSTFQLFRAKLIVNEQAQRIFVRSLSYARESGFLKKNRKMKLALDSTNIFGRGAVKDTYNLLADGIRKLAGILEMLSAEGLNQWRSERTINYFGKSFKGEAAIDWDDNKARQALLQTVVSDVKSLLELAKQHKERLSEDDPNYQSLQEAINLLSDLFLQDIEEDNASKKATIKQEVSRDRIMSVHDPEMRHGRKSKSKRFDGHKGTVATDTESKLITATDVIAGNASDSENALQLCQQSEENTGCEVDAALGDTAYGSGEVRREFAQAGVDVIAKTPPIPNRGTFTKEKFNIDAENNRITCPAGHTTTTWHHGSSQKRRDGRVVSLKVFKFDDDVCGRCQFRQQCISGTSGKGRTVSVHPEETLLQEARDFQKTETFKEQYRARTIVEHRIARLVQLGIRQSRYFGRNKSAFQLAMAAAVANFTLIAAWQAANSHGDSLLTRLLLFALAMAPTLIAIYLGRLITRCLPERLKYNS